MPVADELYLLYHKSSDLVNQLLQEWEDNFEWLEEVKLSAKEARGKTVIPKTPANRRTKRKRKVSSTEPKFVHPADALKSPKSKRKKAQTKEKASTQDDESTNEPCIEKDENAEATTTTTATRAGTRRTTRARAHKKDQPIEPSAADKSQMEEKADKETESSPAQEVEEQPMEIDTKDSIDETVTIETPLKVCRKSFQSPVVEDGLKSRHSSTEPYMKSEDATFMASEFVLQESEILPEQEEIEVEQTPRQTRLRTATPKNVRTPKNSAQKRTPRSTSNKYVHKENVPTMGSTGKKDSPYTACHTPLKNSLRENLELSSPKQKHHGTLKKTIQKSKIRPSPLSHSAIRSSLTHGSRLNRIGRAPGTPTATCHSKSKLMSSGSFQRSRPILQAASPLIPNKLVRTASDLGKGSNILTGITSLVSRVLPKQPTKDDIEKEKQAALQLKREKQEESRKKKEDLLKLKAEEQKRKNELRMKRVQETRMLQEKEKKHREDERLRMERERKLRDEERAKEEKDRKRRQQVAKAEEEAIKAARIKAQQEEEEKLRQEQLKREKDQERLQEMKQKMEAQKRALEQKKEAERVAREQYQLMKTLEAKRIEKQKVELAKIKAQEAKRLPQPQTPEVLDSTYTKSPVQSYDMTPAPIPKPADPNNYGIDDRRSDDSTDEEDDPKKEIPAWAMGTSLKSALFEQELYSGEVEEIFPPKALLQAPDLDHIFFKKRSRFFKRTSSAVWNTPPELLG